MLRLFQEGSKTSTLRLHDKQTLVLTPRQSAQEVVWHLLELTLYGDSNSHGRARLQGAHQEIFYVIPSK